MSDQNPIQNQINYINLHTQYQVPQVHPMMNDPTSASNSQFSSQTQQQNYWTSTTEQQPQTQFYMEQQSYYPNSQQNIHYFQPQQPQQTYYPQIQIQQNSQYFPKTMPQTQPNQSPQLNSQSPIIQQFQSSPTPNQVPIVKTERTSSYPPIPQVSISPQVQPKPTFTNFIPTTDLQTEQNMIQQPQEARIQGMFEKAKPYIESIKNDPIFINAYTSCKSNPKFQNKSEDEIQWYAALFYQKYMSAVELHRTKRAKAKEESQPSAEEKKSRQRKPRVAKAEIKPLSGWTSERPWDGEQLPQNIQQKEMSQETKKLTRTERARNNLATKIVKHKIHPIEIFLNGYQTDDESEDTEFDELI